MPRGRKKQADLTAAQKIEKVTAEIAELNIKLKAKKAELKKLEKEKDKEAEKEILKAVAASGLSAAEIVELLKK